MNPIKARCADCGAGMNILAGMIPMNLMREGKLKYSTQCKSCDRNYCSKCRPEEQSCQCGAKDWRTRPYTP